MPNKPKVEFQSWQEWPGKPEKSFPLFNVWNAPGLAQGTTVVLSTLERSGVPVPDYPTLEEWKANRELVANGNVHSGVR